LRNHRAVSLLLLALLLPLPVRAALTPAGTPLIFASTDLCSFETELEVIATPKGAFEVIWADFAQDEEVKALRFGRNLEPAGSPVNLLPIHGGLVFTDFLGAWAGRYEVVLNAGDFGNNPGDPVTSYRVSLDLAGDPVAPPARIKPPRFIKLAPAARGDSLQFRSEPPFFGPLICQSQGLLVRRINGGGAPISAESRVNRRASAWGGNYLAVDRLPNDTFIAAYSTCEKFIGVVARRLNASGVPVGNPVNLPFPGRVGNAGANPGLAAHSSNDFALAVMVSDNSIPGVNGAYTRGVVNGQVFGPTRLSPPPGYGAIAGVVDLEASPSGGYLLLFQGANGAPQRRTLFAQELDARGVPQGAPVAVTGDGEFGVAGAVASLPDGRWIVVTREQSSDDATACSERLVRTILAGD
jgi:hypothetical protein